MIFLTELHVAPAGERRWRLLAPLICDADDGCAYIVPPGFVTDFASTPRLLWWLIPPFGRHSAASALHDWLYAADRGVTRRRADGLFREAMVALEVAAWKRNLMYVFVRIAGAGRWKGRTNHVVD
jgi:hypothetical protein